MEKKLYVTGGIVAGLVLIYAAGGFWAIPASTNWALKKYVDPLIDREVSTEKVEFNPFTLHLNVKGLNVQKARDPSALLRIEEIDTKLKWSSLFKFAPLVDHFKVDQLQANIVRTGLAQFNFSDIIDKFVNQPEEPKEKDKDDSPQRFSIDNFEIVNSGIKLDDKFRGKVDEITDLQFALPLISNFDTQVEHPITPKLSFNFDGEPLSIDAKSLPFSISKKTGIDFELKSLNLSNAASFNPVPLNAHIVGGTADAKLNLAFANQDAKVHEVKHLRLKGQVTINNLVIQDDIGKPYDVLTVKKIEADLKEFALFAQRLDFGEIKVTDPNVIVTRNTDGLNLAILAQNILKKDDAPKGLSEEETPSASEQTPVQTAPQEGKTAGTAAAEPTSETSKNSEKTDAAVAGEPLPETKSTDTSSALDEAAKDSPEKSAAEVTPASDVKETSNAEIKEQQKQTEGTASREISKETEKDPNTESAAGSDMGASIAKEDSGEKEDSKQALVAAESRTGANLESADKNQAQATVKTEEDTASKANKSDTADATSPSQESETPPAKEANETKTIPPVAAPEKVKAREAQNDLKQTGSTTQTKQETAENLTKPERAASVETNTAPARKNVAEKTVKAKPKAAHKTVAKPAQNGITEEVEPVVPQSAIRETIIRIPAGELVNSATPMSNVPAPATSPKETKSPTKVDTNSSPLERKSPPQSFDIKETIEPISQSETQNLLGNLGVNPANSIETAAKDQSATSVVSKVVSFFVGSALAQAEVNSSSTIKDEMSSEENLRGQEKDSAKPVQATEDTELNKTSSDANSSSNQTVPPAETPSKAEAAESSPDQSTSPADLSERASENTTAAPKDDLSVQPTSGNRETADGPKSVPEQDASEKISTEKNILTQDNSQSGSEVTSEQPLDTSTGEVSKTNLNPEESRAVDASKAKNNASAPIGQPEQQIQDTVTQSSQAQTSEVQPSDAAQAENSWFWNFDKITVQNGTVDFNDETAGFRKEIKNLNATISSLNGEKGSKAEFEADLNVLEGSIGAKGDLSLTPMVINIEESVKDLSVAEAMPYISQFVDARISEGRLSNQGKLTLNLSSPTPEITFEGSAQAAAVSILDAKNTPFAKWQILNINNVLVNSGKDISIALGDIALAGPEAAIVRFADGSFNFEKLVKTAAPTQKSSTTKSESKPQPEPAISWSIGKASIENGLVHFNDQTVNFKKTISQLNASVSALSSHPGQTSSFEASLAALGGSINSSGTFNLSPFKLNLKETIKGLQLAELTPYINQYTNAHVVHGQLSNQGSLVVSLNGEEPDIHFDGSSTVSAINLTDAQGTPFARWQDLKINGIKFASAPKLTIAVNNVALTSPSFYISKSAKGKFNVETLVKTEDGKASKTASAPAAPAVKTSSSKANASSGLPSITLNKVTIANGSVLYKDNAMDPVFNLRLSELKGSLSDFTTAKGTPALLDIVGKLNGTPMTAKGSIAPFAKSLSLNLDGSVTSLSMPIFSPYSIDFTGYPIKQGQVTYKGAYKVENGELTSTNNIVINKLEFGAVSPRAKETLPVGLAVSLLQDRSGQIDLNLPVTGSLNDPEFSVGGIIVKVIVNLITKAVTAPFALIGSMFGGDNLDLNNLQFVTGSSRLNDQTEKALAVVGKAMTERPGIKIQIVGIANSVLDEKGLKERNLRRQMIYSIYRDSSTSTDAKKLTPVQMNKAIKNLFNESEAPNKPDTNKPEEMMNFLLQNIRVPSQDLQALATRRAEAVRDYLINKEKINPDRLFVVAGDVVNNADTTTGVKLELQQ